MEEMEFSTISKMNTRLSEKEKDKHDKGKVEKNGLGSEDMFCQALAMDLKQLPIYERCIAKHELQNVLYKHQMAVMERQIPKALKYQTHFRYIDGLLTGNNCKSFLLQMLMTLETVASTNV